MLSSVTLALKALADTDNPNGEFEAILSTDAVDREGESVATKAFEPLPASIPIYHQHDGILKGEQPIGRGTPYYEGDVLKIKGFFASTAKAQEIRALVNEGVIDSMSAGILNPKKLAGANGAKSIVKGELFEGSMTAIPMNTSAAILASKALDESVDLKAGARNSQSDQARIQAAHDALVEAGAMCAAAKSVDETEVKSIAPEGAVSEDAANLPASEPAPSDEDERERQRQRARAWRMTA